MRTLTKQPYNITVLAGGVGGAKMAEGLAFSRYSEKLNIIGNVADDQEFHGLWVSPDIDTLTYTLAELIDQDKGWGIKNESNRTLDALNRLDVDTWMYLGDQDFATHIYRSQLRRQGGRPSAIASHIACRLGVKANIILPTDDRIQTRIKTDKGWLDFQSYFVREGCKPVIHEIAIDGIEQAAATEEALRAISEADLIVFAPSNPIVSIGAILAISGIRQALLCSSAYKIAVSPLINGQAVKGPTEKMMVAAGYRCDHNGIADCYQGLIDALVIDESDSDAAAELTTNGLAVLTVPTLMTTRQHKIDLAESLVEFFAANSVADGDPVAADDSSSLMMAEC